MEEKNKEGIAIYHCVKKHENFEKAAQDTFNLVKNASEYNQKQKRVIYLDIEGHKNSVGGFDNDMLKLQTNFIMSQIMPYISELYQPLGHVINKEQKDFVMKELKILEEVN